MSKRQLQGYMLVTIILLAVVTLTSFNYHSSKKLMTEKVKMELTELLHNFSDETDKFTIERVAELKLIADYVAFLENDLEIIRFLSKQREEMPFFKSINFISIDGEVLTNKGSLYKVEHQDSFERALLGETVFSELFPSYEDPTKMVTAVRMPIIKNGQTVGVISGVLNMGSVLGAIASDSTLPGTMYLFKENDLVYTTSAITFEKKIPNGLSILKQIQENKQGTFVIDEDIAHFVMYQRAGDNWTVVVDSSTEEMENQMSFIFWRNVLIIVFTIFVLCVVLLFIRRMEVREQKMLKRDLLTHLPNRVLLEEQLNKDLNQQKYKKFTLFFINLDRFKDINERNGYQLGDRVLYQICRKIQAFVGKNELYRIGGDELVFLVPSHSDQELIAIGNELIKLMEEPIELSTFESAIVTCSIGIRKSELGDWPDLMMQDATFAVHEAKKLGGNRSIFFSQELANQNERVRLIANHFVHALANQEYFMVYQPVYELSKKQITSYEALLRWESPIIGPVSPAEFIPLLEESDLIIPVGKWILRHVATQLKQWEKEGQSDFRVATNISVKQMMHPDFLKDVKTIINETRVSPQQLVFEITETVAVQNSRLATQILTELNELGVQTSLDDFGTGYSSLSILKLLPIQQLKVDRSFIVEMQQDEDKSLVILQGILNIANNLGMSTVMEGVEMPEQLQLLKDMGAKKIQGYLISRPVEAEQAIELRKIKWTY